MDPEEPALFQPAVLSTCILDYINAVLKLTIYGVMDPEEPALFQPAVLSTCILEDYSRWFSDEHSQNLRV